MHRVELEGEFVYIYVQIVEITIRVIWPLSRYWPEKVQLDLYKDSAIVYL